MSMAVILIYVREELGASDFKREGANKSARKISCH